MRRSVHLRAAIAATAALPALSAPGVAAAFNPPPIKHVFVIVDENESAATTFGTNSPAPYLARTLPAEGAFLPDYYGIGHNSLDNYIAMVSGQAPNPLTSSDCGTYANFDPADGLGADGQQTGEGCVYPADVPTLMSQLDAAHLTWRGYEDSMGVDLARDNPGSPTDPDCGHPIIGSADGTETESATDQYATKHDPFVYFHYVIDNQAECNADVVPLSQLASDLQSASATPNYALITPGLCDDGHDPQCANGGPGGLAQADTFLQTVVPEITASPAYEQGGLLIVTFDEADTSDVTACCNETAGPFESSIGASPGLTGPGGGVVGAVLLSPFITPRTVSKIAYNHYSMLGSVEHIFGLSTLGEATGAGAFGADVYTRPDGIGAAAITAGDVISAISPALVPPASTRASTVAKRGYTLTVRALEPGAAVVQWYEVPEGARLARAAGHAATPAAVLVASGSASFQFNATLPVKLAFTKAGRKLLQGGTSLQLTAKGTFTPTGGRAIVTTRRFTLR